MQQPAEPQKGVSPSIDTSHASIIRDVKLRWAVLGGGLLGLAVLLAALLGASKRPIQAADTLAARATSTLSPRHASAPITSRTASRVKPTLTTISRAKPSTTRLPSSASLATTIPAHKLIEARVVRVISGDMMEVEIEGRAAGVKLSGIAAPGTPGIAPPMCFGQEAKDYAQETVDRVSGRVWLERDVSNMDGSGSLLRYVWVELPGSKRMLNEALLEGGFAKAAVSPPDTRYEDRFLTVEYGAKVEKRGLWGGCGGFGVPVPTRTAMPFPSVPIIPTILGPSPTKHVATPSMPPTSTPVRAVTPTALPSATPRRTPTDNAPQPSPTKRASPTTRPTQAPTLRAATPIPMPPKSITSPTVKHTPTRLVEKTHTPQPTHDGPPPTSTSVDLKPTATLVSEPAQPTQVSTTVPMPTPTAGLRYDPNGPDRDCADFETWEEAQAFYIAAGGPERDPHRLDRDRDGIACEELRKRK